ncbi:hypothetical protein K501DRAFT_276205 [Backusella circina FSU 941]|nr:hypothetical protein K501DRAFT_276205 [Backusella circina FSU 941]
MINNCLIVTFSDNPTTIIYVQLFKGEKHQKDPTDIKVAFHYTNMKLCDTCRGNTLDIISFIVKKSMFSNELVPKGISSGGNCGIGLQDTHSGYNLESCWCLISINEMMLVILIELPFLRCHRIQALILSPKMDELLFNFLTQVFGLSVDWVIFIRLTHSCGAILAENPGFKGHINGDDDTEVRVTTFTTESEFFL